MSRAKKTTTKGKKGSSKRVHNANPIVQKTDENQEQDNNEYGILPNRDLKKNLGCG